jgi:hypothetical protein
MLLVLQQAPTRLLRQPTLWLLSLSLSLVACGGAPGEHPGPADFDPSIQSAEPAQSEQSEPEAETEASIQSAACVDGQRIACRVPLPKQGNIENCFVGVRTCVAGAWSNCHEP